MVNFRSFLSSDYRLGYIETRYISFEEGGLILHYGDHINYLFHGLLNKLVFNQIPPQGMFSTAPTGGSTFWSI